MDNVFVFLQEERQIISNPKGRLISTSSRTNRQILNSLFFHIKIYVLAHKITGRMLSSAFEVIFQIVIIAKSWNILKKTAGHVLKPVSL